MRKALALGVVLVFAATAMASFFDDFDSYADQAAFDAAWGAGQTLDQAKGYSDGQSVSNDLTSKGQISQALGAEYEATDATPLVLEVMVDVDELHWWTRSYVRLEGSTDGTTDDLAMLGFNSSNGQTYYHGRGGSGWTWWDIGATTGDSVFTRTTEWRKLQAIIKDNEILFYVDDTLGTVVSKNAGYTYDTISIGTSYSSQEIVWFDDLAVYNIPEPAALALLALGLLIRRR